MLNRRPERRLRGFSLSQLTAPRQESSNELVSRIFKTHRRHYPTLLSQPGQATAQFDTCRGSEPISGPNTRSTDRIPAHFPRFRSAFYRHNNPTAAARHPASSHSASVAVATHTNNVHSLCPFLTGFGPRGVLWKSALGAFLAHGVLVVMACSNNSQTHSGTLGRRGQAKTLSLTLRFNSVSRFAGRVRHTGDTLAGGAVEAVCARAGGSFAEVVDGLLKVSVCGSVEDRLKVRTQQERQRGVVAPLLLVSQYGWGTHLDSLVNLSWYSSSSHFWHWGSRQLPSDIMLVPGKDLQLSAR